MSPSTPVVQARDLCRRFGRRWVVARVDLDVQPGERLLVIGANGSGKSTLLNLLSTLLPITRGSLRLFGLDPVQDRAEVRRRLAIVRHAHGMYEDLSARDNLSVRASLLGRRIDIPRVLDQVRLEDRVDPIRAYSAGMRKRLQLAMLQFEAPELAMLDEPFSALDPAGCADVEGMIRQLPGAVIIVSHQVERAGALCDRAILLEHGLLRWSGPASQAWDAWRAVQRDDARTPAGSAAEGGPR